MLSAALALLGGCASSAPKDPAASGAPVEISEAQQAQPRRLERPAPSAKEIESPLKAGEGEGLPILAEGDTPVGEGGQPRASRPQIPPARPGTSPVVEEVIVMPTEELHGGAFPGVGATPKQSSAPRADDAVTKRIADIEQQLATLRESAAKKPAAAPDMAAFNAVQARLEELNSKIAQVESEQKTAAEEKAAQETPAASAERVQALENQVASLQRALETRNDAAASKKEREAATKSLAERLNALETQVTGLGKSVSSDDLAQRLQSVQSQLDSLEAKAATEPEDKAMAKRLDALSARVAEIETRPEPPHADQATGVAPERVAAIESQVAELRAMATARDHSSAKDRAASLDNFATKLNDLEGKIAGLDESISKTPEDRNAEGMSLGELSNRLEAMQAQLNEVAARPAAEPGSQDAKLQKRIDTLAAQVGTLREEQAQRSATAPAEVPEARFEKIEQQIAGIEAAINAPKDAAQSQEMMDHRFGALESQLDALRGELEKQSAALAARNAAPNGVDGSVHTAMRAETDEYRIGAGDKVEFQSFNDEKISREELVVRFDGYLSLPLIPDVAVGNLTRSEAEERIREEYRAIFRDPQIALIVRDAASKSYAIVGDVEKPGVYPYTTSTKLIEAISLAGGLRRRSSSSSVGGFVGVTGQLTKAFIIRTVNGQREVLQFDLRSLGTPGAHDSEVPVRYGDLIYIPEGVNLVYLLGESRNPVIVELTEGMKLLQLLALSGGFDSSTARLNGVVLMRQVDGENTQVLKMNVREMLRTGKDVPLVPGDIVYIPRKRLVALQEFVSRFTGSISPVLDLYTSAVDAYYAKDLQQSLINQGGGNRTLEVLNNLESFGSSTSNIVDLFRRP